MNQPDMFEDSFEDSLRSLAPTLPPDTKSRLLFECGMAAAEAKARTSRWKIRTVASTALLVAASLGFVAGNLSSNSNPHIATSENEPSAKVVEPQLAYSTSANTRNRKMLAVAMAPSEVEKLLSQVDGSEEFSLPEAPASPKSPFGTRSLSSEL